MRLSIYSFLLLLVYVTLLPLLQSSSLITEGMYDQKRVFQLYLVCTFSIFLLTKDRRRALTDQILSLPYWVQVGFIISLFIGVISTISTTYPQWALIDLSLNTLLLLVILGLAGLIQEKWSSFIKWLLITVLGFSTLYLFRVFLSYILFQFDSLPLWPGSESSIGLFGFADKRFFNQVQTWTFPIIIVTAFYYWKKNKEKVLRFGTALIAVGWIVLLIASGGRGTMLSLIISLGILLSMFSLERKQLIKYIGAIMVFAVSSYFLFFEFWGTGTEPSLMRSHSSGRFDVWIELLPEILQAPLWGYGPMHYSSIHLSNAWGHPHNWFLQISYEYGLIVSLFLLTTCIWAVWKFSEQLISNEADNAYPEKKKWAKFALLWSVLAAFLHAFLSGIIIMPLSQIWMVLLVGISIGMYFSESKVKTTYSIWTEYSITLLILITSFTVVYFGIYNPPDRYSYTEYLKKEKKNLLHPRFWQQGKIGFEELPKSELKQTEKSNL